MAEKYDGYSPYGYAINNPILFTDPNGQEIWINYGDDKRVQYKNGKLYNEDGSRFKGKDSFVNAVKKELNKMNSVEIGGAVLSALSTSKNNFTFTNTLGKGDNNMGASFTESSQGGGEIHAASLLNDKLLPDQKLESIAHELFHGYQKENGETGTTVNREVGAYLFGTAVRTSYNMSNSGLNAMFPFGNSTNGGANYEKAMSGLLYAPGFNQQMYNSALNNFKPGAVANSTGVYNNTIIKNNDTNPVIKKFFPLIRY